MSRYQPPELLAARHQLAGFRCRSLEQSSWLAEMAKQAHATGTTRVFVVTESEQPAPTTSKVLRPVRPKAHLGRCLAGSVPASQVKSYRRSWLIDTLKRFRAQLTGG